MSVPASLRRTLPAILALVPATLALVFGGCSGSSQVAAGETESGQDGVSAIALPDFSVRDAQVARGAPVARTTGQSSGAPVRAQEAGTRDRGKGSIDVAALGKSVESRVAAAMAEARKVHPGKIKDSNVVVGVAVRDLRTGELLYGRSAKTPLRPASTLKVLTTGAALLGLGANASFETSFSGNGTLKDGLLQGDLVVHAGGDPLYRRDGDGSMAYWTEPLIAALRTAGVRSISGKLILDEGTFGTPGPAPEWPAPSQHWQAYCGLSGGFSANGGVFRSRITPGRRGQAARVQLRPRHHGLEERVGVKTVDQGNNVRIGATATTVTVGGSYGAGRDPYDRDFRHPDPVNLFGHTLAAALVRSGMLETARFERRRGAPAGNEFHVMKSPIAGVLVAILQDSNNPVADQLFLTLGHRLGAGGTRQASARAVARAFQDAGHTNANWGQVDGSGLSKANRVTASQLAEAVGVIVRGPAGVRDAFLGALSEAARSGSLSKRMGNTAAEGRVRAKTGWVGGVSGLSGVILDRRRRPQLGFSILVEYPRVGSLNTRSWKPMQDGICADLCELIDAASARAGAGSR